MGPRTLQSMAPPALGWRGKLGILAVAWDEEHEARLLALEKSMERCCSIAELLLADAMAQRQSPAKDGEFDLLVQ